MQLAGTVDISRDQLVQSNGELKGCGRRDAGCGIFVRKPFNQLFEFHFFWC